MAILGVDVGYNLGYAVLGEGLLEHGLLRTRGDVHRRLAEIFEHVSSIIRRFGIECVAVEKLFYAKSIPSLVKLAESRGAVLAAAGAMDVPVVELHPADVKKGITGNGAATKEQVLFMVKNIFGIDGISHHEADAIAIALYARRLREAAWSRT